jgi:hypothetical protein
VGEVIDAQTGDVDRAMRAAKAGYPAWQAVPVHERSEALRRAANQLEAQRGLFLHLLHPFSPLRLCIFLGDYLLSLSWWWCPVIAWPLALTHFRIGRLRLLWLHVQPK